LIKGSSLGEEGAHFEERVVGGEGSLIPREFSEHGERRRTASREAHLSGEEEGMHPKTVADIEQDRTAVKGIRTVRIC
jgi:hypothetical protein